MQLVRLVIVEGRNKPQFDYEIVGETQGSNYVKANRTRALRMKLLAGQILLLLTHGASQTAHLRRVCNKVQ